jgi:hypothetical protein
VGARMAGLVIVVVAESTDEMNRKKQSTSKRQKRVSDRDYLLLDSHLRSINHKGEEKSMIKWPGIRIS